MHNLGNIDQEHEDSPTSIWEDVDVLGGFCSGLMAVTPTDISMNNDGGSAEDRAHKYMGPRPSIRYGISRARTRHRVGLGRTVPFGYKNQPVGNGRVHQ